mgnify:FL=1
MPETTISKNYILTNHSASLAEHDIRDEKNDIFGYGHAEVHFVGTGFTDISICLTGSNGNIDVYHFSHTASSLSNGDVIPDDGRILVKTWQGSWPINSLEVASQFRLAVNANQGDSNSGVTSPGIATVDVGKNNSVVYSSLGTTYLSQSVTGSGGNTKITFIQSSGYMLANSSDLASSEYGPYSFIDGQDFTASYKAADVLPYKSSVKGAFNLRGQSREKPYKTFIG